MSRAIRILNSVRSGRHRCLNPVEGTTERTLPYEDASNPFEWNAFDHALLAVVSTSLTNDL
jgi:hypothetical protein